MECREEVTHSVTRGGRLLLLTDERRLLDLLLHVLLTGSTVRHRMSLLRVHLLVLFQASLVVEVLATHVACESKKILVDVGQMCLEAVGTQDQITSFVWACNASSLVH